MPVSSTSAQKAPGVAASHAAEVPLGRVAVFTG